MEKIAKERKRFEDFPSTTLYLDDLAEILGTLAKVCKNVEARAGDYKISDPAELDALASKFPKGRFGDVYLQGHDPYVSINLRMSGVSAYISDDTLEQRGLVEKIRDTVQRGKKRNLHPGWLFSGLSYIAVVVATWQFMTKEYLTGSLLIVLSVALIPISARYSMKNAVIIHSQSRGSVRTFFDRKKDDIALAFIAAFVGGVITYLTTRLLP